MLIFNGAGAACPLLCNNERGESLTKMNFNSSKVATMLS